MKTTRWFSLALALGCLFVGRAQARESDGELIANAQSTLQTMQSADPSLHRVIANSAGYAILPSVGKGGLGVGGAKGHGILFDRDGTPVARVTLKQVTVGLQAGGQSFAELILFETPQAFADFQHGRTEFAAQMSAVAIAEGASTNARFRNGVAVFTLPRKGLMAEMSVGGQKFKIEPLER